MYVFIQSESSLWTVGHYEPTGKWISSSDHDTKDDAAERVAWLNGETEYRSAVALRGINALRKRVAELEEQLSVERDEYEARIAALTENGAELEYACEIGRETIAAKDARIAELEQSIAAVHCLAPVVESNKALIALLRETAASYAEGCAP